MQQPLDKAEILKVFVEIVCYRNSFFQQKLKQQSVESWMVTMVSQKYVTYKHADQILNVNPD